MSQISLTSSNLDCYQTYVELNPERDGHGFTICKFLLWIPFFIIFTIWAIYRKCSEETAQTLTSERVTLPTTTLPTTPTTTTCATTCATTSDATCATTCAVTTAATTTTPPVPPPPPTPAQIARDILAAERFTKNQVIENIHWLVTEMRSENYPFQFQDEILENLILRVADSIHNLTEEEIGEVVQHSDFPALYAHALPVILQRVQEGYTRNLTGLDDLMGRVRSRVNSSDEHHYHRMQSDSGENNVNIDQCFPYNTLIRYLLFVKLITKHKLRYDAATTTFSKITMVQLHRLTHLLKLPLSIHAHGRTSPSHPAPSALEGCTTDLDYITRLLGLNNNRPNVSDMWFTTFNANPRQTIEDNIKALSNAIAAGRYTTENVEVVSSFGQIIYHFIQLAADQIPVVELEQRLFTILSNYRRQGEISRVQQACIRELEQLERRTLTNYTDILECRRQIQRIMKISERSYGETTPVLGISNARKTLCNRVGQLRQTLIDHLDQEAFRLAVRPATTHVRANKCQMNLPGINLLGADEVWTDDSRSSPSQHACGPNAAYAVYMDLCNTPHSDNLLFVIRLATSRYQAILRQIAENQLNTLQRLVQASDADRPERRREAKRAFLDAGWTDETVNAELDRLVPHLRTHHTTGALNTLRNEFLTKLDRVRPYTSYELLMSTAGFQNLLERTGDESVMPLNDSDTVRQYNDFLTEFSTMVPNDPAPPLNQAGAIVEKGHSFFGITMRRTTTGFSVTIIDSHGSFDSTHADHYYKAFKITFNNIADAANFLAEHHPYNPNGGKGDHNNLCTLMPVRLATPPAAGTEPHTRLMTDQEYANLTTSRFPPRT